MVYGTDAETLKRLGEGSYVELNAVRMYVPIKDGE